MPDAISIFFDAWQLTCPHARAEKIASAVTENIQYDDPRTEHTISSVDALSEYVGLFTANAPGWSAKVVTSDTIAEITRATIMFSGKGPNGKEIVQYGQYYIEKTDHLISKMVGFAGTGEPSQG